ncbi:MAG TPA: hypothetical protein VHX99_02800 [Rhizomicrobium sp.]|jgi:hypothetical protein|nr:hypothetical protein [Rhizomicrobium sp.]
MRFLRNALLAAGLSLGAMPAMAAGTGMALDGTAILADPSLDHGHVLPASAATAGVAAVSAAQDGPLRNCSRRNPCATPTPARDQVAVTPGQAAVIEATHGPSPRTHRMMAGMPRLHS